MAKKTNYIQFELEQFERHIKELQEFLDENSPSSIEDRKELVPARGDGPPSYKVIATKETQIKSYRDSLKEVPALLSALNALRKEVDGEKEDVNVRGGQDVPGFMDDDDDDDEPVNIKEVIKIPPPDKIKLDKPVKNVKSKLAGDDDDDDDDEPIIKPKKITPRFTQWETDEEFDDDY